MLQSPVRLVALALSASACSGAPPPDAAAVRCLDSEDAVAMLQSSRVPHQAAAVSLDVAAAEPPRPAASDVLSAANRSFSAPLDTAALVADIAHGARQSPAASHSLAESLVDVGGGAEGLESWRRAAVTAIQAVEARVKRTGGWGASGVMLVLLFVLPLSCFIYYGSASDPACRYVRRRRLEGSSSYSPTATPTEFFSETDEQPFRLSAKQDLGVYVVLKPDMPVTIEASSDSSEIATLSAGEVVIVREIRPCPEDSQLLRGRLHLPPGWVSLEHIGAGTSFAAKQRAGPVVMHGLLEGRRIGLTMNQQLVVTRLADPRAAQCGWCVGDRVLKVNGVPVRGEDDFLDQVQRSMYAFHERGQPLIFDVARVPPDDGLW